MLHAEDLLLGVRVVGDVDKLSNIRRVDLLIFTKTREENMFLIKIDTNYEMTWSEETNLL